MSLTSEQVKQFQDEGYLILPDFADDATVESLKAECHRLIEEMNPADHNTVFTTLEMKRVCETLGIFLESQSNSDSQLMMCSVYESLARKDFDKHTALQTSTSDDYFMTSGDKIRYFFEEGARDEKGNLKVNKHLSINKIGHALHVLSEPFKKFTFSEKIQGIAKSIGMVDPVVCQSMYIFKQPGIGGEVIPHQDSTFLYTSPHKLLGMWIALEDATLENGCLWFIPESHKNGIHGNRRMIRNPNKGENESRTMFTGEQEKYDPAKFVAGSVKKGTMVLIHGEVVHKSEKNLSQNSRHIYTFHVYDQHGTEYSKDNWLQPTKEMPFPHLYS